MKHVSSTNQQKVTYMSFIRLNRYHFTLYECCQWTIDVNEIVCKEYSIKTALLKTLYSNRFN